MVYYTRTQSMNGFTSVCNYRKERNYLRECFLLIILPMPAYFGSLSQGTHIRFADSDDDDEGEDNGVAVFSSCETTESKDNLNDSQDDMCLVDDLPLVFEAENELDSEGIGGENEIITVLEARKRKRKSTRIIEKMPTEACTSFLFIFSLAFKRKLLLL